MSKRTLADLKAAYASTEREGGQQFTNNYYPFWNMKTGERAVVRFLPDKNEDNPRGFLVEKVFHNLEINGKKRMVPCLSMYGEECPVCKVSQDYYKNKDETNGKKYWRKKQYIAQVIVVEDPLPADENTGETHEGKVRFLTLGWQLYNVVKEAFASEDEPLEGVPYDFEDGYDFIIKKSEQGNYASYQVGSKFMGKQRALGDEELEIVEEGLTDLTTLLPKNPGLEKVQAMLNADLNNENFEDGDNSDSDESDEEAPAPKAKPTPKPTAKPTKKVVDEEEAPAPKATKKAPKADESDDEAGMTDVDEMLAAIRARRNAKKAE